MTKNARKIKNHPIEGGFVVSFSAMASPCEVLVETSDKHHAIVLGQIAANEAWRIEDKYSRYLKNSVCSQLNQQAGQPCEIDRESYQLLAFADQCYQMSDGFFDITSGVLRRVWFFDGSDNIPAATQVNKILAHVGWHQVLLTETSFKMQPDMEIDFGGLGKEYAVDRAIQLINDQTNCSVLINFGGDLAVNKARNNDKAWQVGVDHPGFSEKKSVLIALKHGAIATSGDAKRFLQKAGHRYSHILNVKTGWPIEQAPHSLTVAAPQCIQAGFLATLGLLQGKNAETFLEQQQIKYWSIR